MTQAMAATAVNSAAPARGAVLRPEGLLLYVDLAM